MNVFNQDFLVLEHVTLGLQVKFVVQVFVDFSGLTIFLEKTTEDTDTADPENLEWNSGIGGTTAFTLTSVTSLSLGSKTSLDARARVNNDWFSDDKTVLVQLANVLTRVGHGDVIDLVWVKPDFALTALEHGGGEALLEFERDHCCFVKRFHAGEAGTSF